VSFLRKLGFLCLHRKETRGLHCIQIGRQWCSFATASAQAAVGHQRASKAQPIKFSRHGYKTTCNSHQIDIGRGTVEVRGDEPLKAEEMVSVQFRGNEIKVPRGTVLRTALLQHGLSPHNEGAVLINCR
jgi:hypothetical protein